MEDIKIAYQKQGCLDYLRGLYGFSLASDLCDNNSVDILRYRYNIPDEWINKYWWIALNR